MAASGVEQADGRTRTPVNDEKDVAQIQDGSNTPSPSLSEEIREIDPAIEKKVLRKIDWFFMPAMVVGTLLAWSILHNHPLIRGLHQAMALYTMTRQF